MTDKVLRLVQAKDDQSAAEMLAELAAEAAKHPKRFSRLLVLYEEDLGEGWGSLHSASLHCSTHDAIGLCARAQFMVVEEASE